MYAKTKINMNKFLFLIWTSFFVTTNAKISCYYEDNLNSYLLCTSTENSNTLKKDDLFKKPDVVRIILKKCQISTIEVNTFQTMRFFNTLDLSRNRLTDLPLGLFEMNTLLNSLDLSHNLLTDLQPGIFNNTELKKLYLNGNHLKNIKSGVINIFPYLFQLDLNDNNLIGKNLYTNMLSDVIELNLSGNNMTEVNFLTRVSKLTILIMKNSFIKEFPNFLVNTSMRRLHELDISHNEITTISKSWTFDNLIEVQVFNLSHNLIEYIHMRAFSNLIYLKTLDLSNNRLRYITQDMFERNRNSLRNLDLSYNFIRNIPQRAFDKSALTTFHFSNNNVTFMYENQLLKMSTKVNLMDISFGKNPWQCSCLREFLHEVKQLNLAYDVDHFNGSSPVCVTTDEFVCMRDESVNDLFIDMYRNVIKQS